MSAIEELRREIAAQQEEAERLRVADRQARVALFQGEMQQALGGDLLDELAARFFWADRRAAVELHYRGRVKRYEEQYGSRSRAAIAEWLDNVDEEIARWEEQRRLNLQRLLQELRDGLPLLRCYLNQAEHTAREWKLGDEPELLAALSGFRDRVEQQEARAAAEKAAKKAAAERERQAERAALFDIAATAKTWDELQPLSNRVSDHGYADGDLRHDEELVAAWETARARVKQLEEERETRRVAAESAAFSPFVFYRATYGIASMGEEDVYVDKESFDCLESQPDGEGYWHPVNRKWPVKLDTLVMVERIAVGRPDDMPGWCPQVETEWGAIRVPPGGDDGR